MVQFPNVTSSHSDDGFHEIQLNGKQLVFLFMAATVVSVVIFLCGVLVGRGVRTERTALADAQAMNEPPMADVVPAAPQSIPSADPTTAPAPTTSEDLSYIDRLENGREPAEIRPEPPKPASPKPAAPVAAPAGAAGTVDTKKPVPVATTASAPAPAAVKPEAPAPPKAAPAAAAKAGYSVQVAAMTVRGEAETSVKRLQAKGYSAYVETGSPSSKMYRVRVGPFKTRGDADEVANRLKKEERITPWVVNP